MRLEPREVVEMLARPEQDDRGLDRRLVAPAGRVAKAGKEPSVALRVAGVRRRHGPLIHDRVAEGDVPRLEGVQLAVEALTAALESCLAVDHLRERDERLSCPADARCAADQRADVLDVDLARRTLYEVLPK